MLSRLFDNEFRPETNLESLEDIVYKGIAKVCLNSGKSKFTLPIIDTSTRPLFLVGTLIYKSHTSPAFTS